MMKPLLPVAVLSGGLALILGISQLANAQPATQAKPAPAVTKSSNPATTPIARTDEGWVKRQEAFNARAKQGAEKGDIGVLFIGDSITQGWEGEGKDVWEKFYAKRQAVNLGIGGDRTQHVLFRLQHGNIDGLSKPKEGHAPRLAIVMIGTNNASDTPPEQTAAGIAAIVATLRERLPGTKVLLLGIFPREEKPGELRAKNAKVNEQAAKLADGKMVFYKDIGDRLTEKDGSLSKDVMPDFLHLSPKGYQIWAEAIEEDVRRILEEK